MGAGLSPRRPSAPSLRAQLAAMLDGSAKSGMWDMTRATLDDGTLHVADLSGNGNTLAQANAALQPAASPNGLQFDGLDDQVGFAYPGGAGAAVTVVMLLRLDAGNDASGRIFSDGNAQYGGIYATGQTTPQATYIDGVACNNRDTLYLALNDGAEHVFRQSISTALWAAFYFGEDNNSFDGYIRRAVAFVDADMADAAATLALAKQWVAG